MQKHNVKSITNEISKKISTCISKKLQSQTNKERLEVKLLLIGIKAIKIVTLLMEKRFSQIEK